MMALRRRQRRTLERQAANLADVEEGSEGAKASWIELNFKKRECVRFIPCGTCEGLQKCGCGRLLSSHEYLDGNPGSPSNTQNLHLNSVNVTNETQEPANHSQWSRSSNIDRISTSISPRRQRGKKHRDYGYVNDTKWNAIQNTTPLPTDAFGTLEYQGTGEGDKSQYIRLAHDTHPELVLRLLTEEWGLQRPKMVITVHGGVHNFQLQAKLQRIFCDGLIKAAKTTGAWIMLFGLNTGIGSIVGNALKEHKARSRGKIYSIGVAPWGVVDNREDLIDSQAISSYQTMSDPLSKGAVLNAAHTHFLLVDNGTEGKYGTELKFRRRLERKLSMQPINQKHGGKIPLVCLVLEGGKNMINVVLESVRQSPPIPVIVVDGSGRAADLLAFAHQYAEDDGTMMEELRLQFLITIQNTFACERDQAQFIFLTIMECIRKKDLITIFRLGQGQSKHNDLDNAILTASLKGKRTSAPDMLSLALSWNRIDIATSQIFVYGQQWPILSLEQAMMDALIQDRTDFVKLLMENGVSIHKFLTISRLEELYNIKRMPIHLLYLLQDVRKNITLGSRFTLVEIGQLVESLMGGAYRCNYTRKRFRLYYANQAKGSMKKPSSFSKHLLSTHLSRHDISSYHNDMNSTASLKKPEVEMKENAVITCVSPYPFHDLMVWAVLMKRQKMALFMWQHGEEAVAKALVAAKLYKAMAREAADDELELEEMEELKKYSSEFCDIATQLLEICYRADMDATQHLLTYELKQWSKHTCLSLAIAAQHRDFIAHPCCQLLLNDLWMGGLNVRKNSSLKIILGIVLLPSIFMLQFKSLDELKLMPQTTEEHMDEKSDSSSVSSSSSSSLSSTSSSSSSSTSTSSSSGLQRKPEVVGRGVTGWDHPDQLPEDGYIQFMSHQTQLSVGKKFYEFYNAPITKFWFHTLSFNAFLLIFTYVVLIEMDSMPSVFEWIIVSYVFTLSLEKIREIGASAPSGVFKKLKLWLGQFWHLVDITLIIIFFTGFVLRMMQDDYLLSVGRTFYCINISLWYLRLLNIFSVSKYLGPYVTMVGKMMVDLGTFIILLAVVLISFGITRQALLHPREAPSWILLKNVFLEPYFMLYGEVYATTIDPCSADNENELCVVGSWIVPTAMTLYLLVANILLLNMLIAVFNNTFTKVKNISDKIWKFHRYSMIVEYEFRPILPPPLIILNYIPMIFRKFFKKRKNAIFNSDRGLKLFLDDEDVEKLHDFEEECLDDLFRRKDRDDHNKNSGPSSETMPSKWMNRFNDYIDEAGEVHALVTSHLQSLDERIATLEEVNAKILQLLPNVSEPALLSYDHYEPASDETNLFSMKNRMRFRLHRNRQDSEMSTFSDWNPSNILLHRMKSVNAKRRERHASERQRTDTFAEHKIRKTNSTGNLTCNIQRQATEVQSSTTLATASSHNAESLHALSKLFIEPEEKAVSYQDLQFLKGAKISDQSMIPVTIAQDPVSGSEFFPSDVLDENTPGESRQHHFRSFKSPKKIHPRVEFTKLRKYDSDSSTSSTDTDTKPSSAMRRRKFFQHSTNPHVKSNFPALWPDFQERPFDKKTEVDGKHLTPIEDRSPITFKDHPKLKRGHNSFPTLKLGDSLHAETDESNVHRACTPADTVSNFYKTSSFSRSQTPSSFISPMQSNHSQYKSITDCIDTSKWHDVNSSAMIPPSTPFETWWNKPPNFMIQSSKQRVIPEHTSQDEWDSEMASKRVSSKPHKGKRHRSAEAYPNSSPTSLSVSSRVKSRAHKHRHKRRKRLKKGSPTTIKEAVPCQLRILEENSRASSKLCTSDTVFVVSPPSSNSSSPRGFNNNNGNLHSQSEERFRLDGDDQDSFFSRYATICEENRDNGYEDENRCADLLEEVDNTPETSHLLPRDIV